MLGIYEIVLTLHNSSYVALGDFTNSKIGFLSVCCSSIVHVHMRQDCIGVFNQCFTFSVL